MTKLQKKKAKDYRHGDLKTALIESALLSIETTGDVGFSLRDLSRQAGVTHAAAYRHFPSKKAILIEIAEQGYSKLNESFRSVLMKDPTDIEGLGLAYVLFASENRYHFKVMFHSDIKSSDIDQRTISLGQETFGYLLNAVVANKDAGHFSSQDSRLIAMTAWAAVHGLASLIVNDSLEKKMKLNPAALANVVSAGLMTGFLKRSSC